MSNNKTVCACICWVLVMSIFVRAHESADGKASAVRFRLYHDCLVVAQGSLGKLNKRNFLIDTGTNPTVVDQRIGQQLGIKPVTGSLSTIGAFSGSVQSQIALLPSLQVGSVQANDLRVALADLSSLSSKVGTRIDAIVGLDVLERSSFRIDYNKKEIVFGPVDSYSAAVPFDGSGAFVTVTMTIDGRPIRVMVDTGTPNLFLFANRLSGWGQQLPSAGMALTTDLGGDAPLPEVRLARIRVGKHELGPRNAFIVGKMDCCDFDGVMGISAARMKQIAFDFEHHLFSWQLQDRAFPSMSESAPANCMPAWSPGFTTLGQASIVSPPGEDLACSLMPRAPQRPLAER